MTISVKVFVLNKMLVESFSHTFHECYGMFKIKVKFIERKVVDEVDLYQLTLEIYNPFDKKVMKSFDAELIP